MMQINIGDHISVGTGYLPIPAGWRETARWARRRAIFIAKTMPAANAYFIDLPLRRSLTNLLADSSIWVNYSPVTEFYGETNRVGGKEMAISRLSFRIGRWTVLATLIHELAHVNGAGGGTDPAAERALLACGLGRQSELASGKDDPWTPYQPQIGG